MYFIEVLLGISAFIAIVLILICLVLYICNALMTCITIWFGNW